MTQIIHGKKRFVFHSTPFPNPFCNLPCCTPSAWIRTCHLLKWFLLLPSQAFLKRKGEVTKQIIINLIIMKGLIMVNIQFDYYERLNNGVKIILCGKKKFLLCSTCNTSRFIWVQKG